MKRSKRTNVTMFWRIMSDVQNSDIFEGVVLLCCSLASLARSKLQG